ncbi:MAG TPA: HEAT repeat domain-containing protein [Clostridia bacterium]|nr:HEAT repeat domain-containing protein [Clostridia bacterium]
MKRSWICVIVLAGLVSLLQPIVTVAAADEEQNLIRVLQSQASLREKDAACARLKVVGSSRCVPALETLLTDNDLSHSARYALESMPAREAGQALLASLPKTTGLTKVGIIHSLGLRRELQAASALRKLLHDSDPNVAAATATALGQIGSLDATKALLASVRNSSGAVRVASVDALLRCADRWFETNHRSRALSIYEKLYSLDKSDTVRLAAYRGMIRASGKGGLKLAVRAIEGQPGPEQAAALQSVRDLQVRGATLAFARLLPQVEPPVQIALIEGLAQRGDPAATPALTSLASQSGPAVRIPIINALGVLGDASVVPLVAGFAANGTPPEQKAARQALMDLRRGGVMEMLVEQLSTSSPAVQAELARALGYRGDKAAVPRLLEVAQKGSDSARRGAFQALGMLADEAQLGSLVQLALQAADPARRAEAAEALNVACQRIRTHRGQVDVSPLVTALRVGPSPGRAALLPVCSGLVDPQVRVALRTAIQDPDPQVQSAAIRTLCDTTDVELLEDLVGVAQRAKEDNIRTLATAGGVRLATQEESGNISTGQRVAALRALLSVAARVEDKRMVLAGLGELPDPEALRVIEPVLEDAAVKSEAARAAVKVAEALPGREARSSVAVLKKGMATADDTTRQVMEAAIKRIEDNADYITDWQVAGPYQQAGKDYSALFDIVFPPETGNAPDVRWQAMPAGTDAKRPFVMDLLKLFGSQQAVAYARTWIHCDQEQQVLMEFGSDDGAKVWLNEKQVYAVNVPRALSPGSDRVNLPLHAGWNLLLLKINQLNQGWEFCVRLRKADGSPSEGIRCEATPKTSSAPSAGQ